MMCSIKDPWPNAIPGRSVRAEVAVGNLLHPPGAPLPQPAHAAQAGGKSEN